MSFNLQILFVSFLVFNTTSGLQCVDEEGHVVDWFVLIKLPKDHASQNDMVKQGLGFVQFTSRSSENGWSTSKLAIDDPLSPPGRTLAPLYSGSEKSLQIFYNDEHPNGNTSMTAGHTKGVVAFGKASGFWLIHSVPKYPPPDQYGYPPTGHMYGQSFLCISLNSDNSADQVGVQLQFNYPYIYKTVIPKGLSTLWPQLTAAATGKHVRKAPFMNVLSLSSLEQSLTFVSFAKYTKFGKDLYADLVAPILRVGLLAETWPNGKGRMTSRCHVSYPVENIASLKFATLANFTTHHDHAKWAISLEDGKSILCIGDINRMNTQTHRAGGTLCFSHKAAWKAFHSIINDIEACPKP